MSKVSFIASLLCLIWNLRLYRVSVLTNLETIPSGNVSEHSRIAIKQSI